MTDKFKSLKLWAYIVGMAVLVIDGWVFGKGISISGLLGLTAIFSGAKAWQNITAMKNGDKK